MTATIAASGDDAAMHAAAATAATAADDSAAEATAAAAADDARDGGPAAPHDSACLRPFCCNPLAAFSAFSRVGGWTPPLPPLAPLPESNAARDVPGGA
ncbi:hypothetical protein [Burkholderia guangdongensis]|uniref:hypothetical protein n=1 Tax=Burkholderia guangdongensis TaxID=1792500 RepID=UPI0015CED23F|nr:hypothetical protein [Burkholderia guangdongensis]